MVQLFHWMLPEVREDLHQRGKIQQPGLMPFMPMKQVQARMQRTTDIYTIGMLQKVSRQEAPRIKTYVLQDITFLQI